MYQGPQQRRSISSKSPIDCNQHQPCTIGIECGELFQTYKILYLYIYCFTGRFPNAYKENEELFKHHKTCLTSRGRLFDWFGNQFMPQVQCDQHGEICKIVKNQEYKEHWNEPMRYGLQMLTQILNEIWVNVKYDIRMQRLAIYIRKQAHQRWNIV